MISPEDNYRDHAQYLEYSRKEIRKVIFFQGLEAPENFLGNCPYEGEEASGGKRGRNFG